MTTITIISILLSIILAVLLWYTDRSNRQANMELLKRIPLAEEDKPAAEVQPLTIERIAEAIRLEGYFPEIVEDGVSFKVQGESYFVSTDRMPLFFIIKSYGIDPTVWEMDMVKEAAHRMADSLIMVKAGIFDNDKIINFFVTAQDRNLESFRANFASYLRVLFDGQQKLSEEYNRMEEERRNAALSESPAMSSVQHENKVMS